MFFTYLWWLETYGTSTWSTTGLFEMLLSPLEMGKPLLKNNGHFGKNWLQGKTVTSRPLVNPNFF
jgi:hypothetical protein